MLRHLDLDKKAPRTSPKTLSKQIFTEDGRFPVGGDLPHGASTQELDALRATAVALAEARSRSTSSSRSSWQQQEQKQKLQQQEQNAEAEAGAEEEQKQEPMLVPRRPATP